MVAPTPQHGTVQETLPDVRAGVNVEAVPLLGVPPSKILLDTCGVLAHNV